MTPSEPLNSSTSPDAVASSASKPKPDNGSAQLIALDLIDEPARAMRDTMDEQALAELAESIARVGLIQPLVLERAGARFRVIAGHRRLIACQIVKLSPVPAIVRDRGEVDPLAITIAENYHREAVNPAEEAAFFHQVVTERCSNDIELAAALLHVKVSYIDDRLLLLRGDQAVLEALREQKISLAVARELNRCKTPATRVWLLDAAIRGGATGAIVARWRKEYDGILEPLELGVGNPTAAPSEAAGAAAVALTCFFCGERDNPHMMLNLWLHSYCKKLVDHLCFGGSTQTPNGA
jgi:ParB/RepB/Spo0J family partition protein